MIYKKRTVPKKIIGQYALIRRLHPTHEKRLSIIENYKNSRAGFGGERHFDKQLVEFRPSYPHAILHDISLKQDEVYFQMDSLLITPESITIFEVKNIAGKLFISANPSQFIREFSSGERKVLRNPNIELERKVYYLTNWLKQRKIVIPINVLIVLAYQNELQIQAIPENQIAFAYEVPNLLRKISITNEVLDRHQIRKLATDLKNSHQEFNPFPIINRYDILQNELIAGVACGACEKLGMLWWKGKWKCEKCGNQTTRWQTDILSDWSCLIGNKITNRQFRSFTLLKNQDVAKRILKHPKLFPKKEGRLRYYEIDPAVINENEVLNDI